ncbi:MAG: Gfo/Idh/MocA family oxidoreductase [Bacteroidetes bacterium]|nr:Gfo/Idh/MocA family oxidoreductase [Bacteroidota bacterium]
MIKVGIIGTGLQFNRRAPVIKEWPNAELTAIASLEYENAIEAAKQYNCNAYQTWQEVVALDELDVILVCTPPYVHADISVSAMRAGKHVLCEKPLSRTIEEAEEMVRVASETGQIFKCGFNHRHHPAIWKAKQIIDSGDLGKPILARCVYGICGRPGYENEWRANPKLAAGGQFIEQGTHAIDLFRWFLGDISEIAAITGTLYFTEQSLDDNGMAVFKTDSGAIASLHTSLTQWINLFHFEIYCADGYVSVEGLGASYSTQKLTVGKKDFTAPFAYETTEFRGGDKSWKAEWKEFCDAIHNKTEPLGNAKDGLACMKIALSGYESEKAGFTKIK